MVVVVVAVVVGEATSTHTVRYREPKNRELDGSSYSVGGILFAAGKFGGRPTDDDPLPHRGALKNWYNQENALDPSIKLNRARVRLLLLPRCLNCYCIGGLKTRTWNSLLSNGK